ncbi:SSU rRNA (adenine(1518)-N(6)/adenine(1519)-N(6))-dimethyltransferase [hydrothermal vent metagenome]|uniref:SSU rRNA (Adenine(1518)-N(6)/adenine(1519)-N(6))-dimethyltransferase n=1 Tax=hydrothermal vent metagenome TaxID=652676 RepID=A0A3B0XYI5_9ZZZZ
MAIQHRARKRFGQNFLSDQSIIQRIVQSINPQPGQRIIEIGPGLGALTCPILNIAEQIDVIELDRDIIPKLQLNCGLDQVQDKHLRIHNMDVLNFDFAQLNYTEPLRIIGNLPYNISTPIIFHLVKYSPLIQDMFFMLQKEVVQRLAAKPDTSNYSRLSVMAQYYFNVTPLFLVPATAFEPIPKVESAIVRLIPHTKKPISVDDDKAFAKLITLAFSQRRKTLRNVLKDVYSPEQLEAVGIDPGCRAQSLTLQQFADIFNIQQSA